MVGTDVDESRVPPQVVNPIGKGPRDFGAREIMPADLAGLFGGQPLLASIVVVAHEFLLLGIDRNDRQPCGQAPLHAGVDVTELGVEVGMIVPFLCLAVALQAIVLRVEELGHLDIADGMSLLGELCGQRSRALADPPQRSLRVPTGRAVNQVFQGAQQTRIRFRELLAARSGTTDKSFRRAHPFLEFPNAFGDRLPG